MRQLFFLFILVFLPIFSNAQEIAVEFRTVLSNDVNETSGLIFIAGKLFTHNDSGDDAYLYEIDTLTGEVIRTIFIDNAGSVDWEDMAADDNYLYLGDFGNNSGSRTDLAIYRVEISDFLTEDIISADTIQFNYADQVDFTPAPFITNFDAEALIAYNDSLYLFTKNWGNFKTDVYSIPKEPGVYAVHKVDQLNSEGLITGADYDPVKNEIVFTGYTLVTPFLFYVKNFEGNSFSEGSVFRFTPPFINSIQIEGVASTGNHQFFVSSETEDSGLGSLHKIDIPAFIGIKENMNSKFSIYPNPSHDFITCTNEAVSSIEIYTLTGSLLLQFSSNTIAIHSLECGVYFAVLKDEDSKILHIEKLIKN